jgi:hypothetical protein
VSSTRKLEPNVPNRDPEIFRPWRSFATRDELDNHAFSGNLSNSDREWADVNPATVGIVEEPPQLGHRLMSGRSPSTSAGRLPSDRMLTASNDRLPDRQRSGRRVRRRSQMAPSHPRRQTCIGITSQPYVVARRVRRHGHLRAASPASSLERPARSTPRIPSNVRTPQLNVTVSPMPLAEPGRHQLDEMALTPTHRSPEAHEPSNAEMWKGTSALFMKRLGARTSQMQLRLPPILSTQPRRGALLCD